jgi:archaellum component FlaC
MFMERETDTDKILRAIAGIHDEVGDIREAIADLKATMATKDDLASLKTEVAELIAGEFAELRSKDIEPMKRSIATLNHDVQKIHAVFAPRLEFDDRLHVIEQKLGIPSPQ